MDILQGGPVWEHSRRSSAEFTRRQNSDDVSNTRQTEKWNEEKVKQIFLDEKVVSYT